MCTMDDIVAFVPGQCAGGLGTVVGPFWEAWETEANNVASKTADANRRKYLSSDPGHLTSGMLHILDASEKVVCSETIFS